MSQKKCSRIEGLEDNYIYGVLPEEDEINLTKHLEKCGDCREILQKWQEKEVKRNLSSLSFFKPITKVVDLKKEKNSSFYKLNMDGV